MTETEIEERLEKYREKLEAKSDQELLDERDIEDAIIALIDEMRNEEIGELVERMRDKLERRNG